MDTSMVVGEKWHSSKSITASKSIESPLLIDSISINLIKSNERNDATNCQHFSLRGYVTQIRKKDWKLCWPFASDEDNNKSEEQKSLLPPLYVPKFRFWRCDDCLGEVDAEGTANDCEVLKSCHNSFNVDNICSNVPVAADVAMCLSHHVSKMDNIGDEGKKVDGSSSDDLSNTIKNQPSACIMEKKKELELPNSAILGDNVQLEINLNQEIHRHDYGAEAASSMMDKNCHADDLVAFMRKYDGSISLSKPFYHHHDVADSESDGGLGYVAISSAKNFEKPRDDGNSKEPLSNMDCAGRSSSLQSEEHDDASSESAEILVGNNLKDLHHEDSSSLPRRKARKVRLLTELLTENEDGDNDTIRSTKDYLSNDALNAISDASTKVDIFAVTQGQLTVQGQAKSVLDQTRKRKIYQDEDWKPAVTRETSSPNRVAREVRTLKGVSEVVGSELQAGVCAITGVQNDLKRHMTKQRLDKGPSLGKRKTQKLKFSEKKISLPVSDDHVPNETAEELGDDSNCTAVDVASSKLPNDALPAREMNLFPLPAQRMERKPSFSTKKKGKMPKIDDQNTSAGTGGIFREGIVRKKDRGIIHSAAFGVPFCPAEDISQERGLELSLNSYIPTEGHGRKYITHADNRNNPFFVWHEGISEDQLTMKAAETKYCQNFGLTSLSAPNASIRKGLDVSLSGNNPNFIIPFLNQKQNLSSQIEIGACSLMQQKDYFTPNNSKKTTENQDHLNIQRVDKVPEQGALDDIPMDIVELMAKNQYERCLPDPEYQNSQLATSDYPICGQTIDFSKAYGKGGTSLFPQEALKGNPRAKNGKNRTIKREEHPGLAKLKSIDYFSRADRNLLNVNQLEQARLLAGRVVDPEENPSNVDQNCVSSSQRQSHGPNSELIGNANTKRFSHTILHGSRPCVTCQWNPDQNEEANPLWQSMLPNHIPFVYRIPPKSGGPSANLTILPCTTGPGSMYQQKTNWPPEPKFPQSSTNIGKQMQNIDSETLRRTHSDYLFPRKHGKIEINEKLVGSLDLYPNETIPAMHLLSLVDAGARSSAQIDKDVSSELLKRPTINSDPSPKQFPGQEPGVYKPPNAIKYIPYNYHGRNQFADCAHGQVPAMSITVGASSASPQHDKSFKTDNEYISHLSQEKHKRKTDFLSQSKGRSRKSAPSGSFGTNCGSVPAHSLQTVFFGTSESSAFPTQMQASGNSTKHKIHPLNNSGIARANKSSTVTQTCCLNRNPADFSIPDEDNEFMIRGEGLKSVEGIPVTNGFHLNSLNGFKRQKKLHAVKAGM